MKQLFLTGESSESFLLAQAGHKLEQIFINDKFTSLDHKINFTNSYGTFVLVVKENSSSKLKFTSSVSQKNYKPIPYTEVVYKEKEVKLLSYNKTLSPGFEARVHSDSEHFENDTVLKWYRTYQQFTTNYRIAHVFNADYSQKIKEVAEYLGWKKKKKDKNVPGGANNYHFIIKVTYISSGTNIGKRYSGGGKRISDYDSMPDDYIRLRDLSVIPKNKYKASINLQFIKSIDFCDDRDDSDYFVDKNGGYELDFYRAMALGNSGYSYYMEEVFYSKTLKNGYVGVTDWKEIITPEIPGESSARFNYSPNYITPPTLKRINVVVDLVYKVTPALVVQKKKALSANEATRITYS